MRASYTLPCRIPCPGCARRTRRSSVRSATRCRHPGASRVAGIRKQSCVQRRCERMNSQGSSTCTSPHNAPSTPPFELPEQRSDEQNLFWTAVAGCMAIANPNGDDDDADPSAALFNRDGAASPLHAFTALQTLSGGGQPPPHDALLSDSGSDNSSFCFKLAAVLASDKRLASQPIALRALQHAGIVDPTDANAEAPLLHLLSKNDLVSGASALSRACDLARGTSAESALRGARLPSTHDAQPRVAGGASSVAVDSREGSSELPRSASAETLSQETLYAESLVSLNAGSFAAGRRREHIAAELTASLTQLAAAELAAHGVDGHGPPAEGGGAVDAGRRLCGGRVPGLGADGPRAGGLLGAAASRAQAAGLNHQARAPRRAAAHDGRRLRARACARARPPPAAARAFFRAPYAASAGHRSAAQ
mmetsp:Transcript_41239/g.113427  ORF Transcript_41239/g.113427 Transcript_41239/m.113427 type:complete len:422 (-) Transcript_41239:222-1487(-)